MNLSVRTRLLRACRTGQVMGVPWTTGVPRMTGAARMKGVARVTGEARTLNLNIDSRNLNCFMEQLQVVTTENGKYKLNDVTLNAVIFVNENLKD